MAADVHADCAAKVSAYTRGKDVLELVPGEHFFGRELEAGSVEVGEFKGFVFSRRYEVVVCHILYGSRLLSLSRRGFARALRSLLSMAGRLVIVEHNGESLDFVGKGMLSVGDIAAALCSFWGIETQTEFSRGFRDNRRNIVVSVRPIGPGAQGPRAQPTIRGACGCRIS